MSDITETIVAQVLKKAESSLTPAQGEILTKLVPSLASLSKDALGILDAEVGGNPKGVASLVADHMDHGDDIIAAWDDIDGKWWTANMTEEKRREALTEFENDCLIALKIGIPLVIEAL